MCIKIKPKAIIFDMDGVIVDSMPYHFIAWYEALRPYGIRAGCIEVYLKEGERWDETLKSFLNRAGIKYTDSLAKKIFKSRQRIFKKFFKRYIFKGAVEFLACLKSKGYLLAMVTGTPRKEVQRILPQRIRQFFDCIVGGDEVKNGKPSPQPFLKAAKKLRIKPRESVVVENAPLGIKSAKNAGMFCIAITTSLPREYLLEADRVVEDLEEITGLIEKGCRLKR